MCLYFSGGTLSVPSIIFWMVLNNVCHRYEKLKFPLRMFEIEMLSGFVYLLRDNWERVLEIDNYVRFWMRKIFRIPLQGRKERCKLQFFTLCNLWRKLYTITISFPKKLLFFIHVSIFTLYLNSHMNKTKYPIV